MPIVSIIVPVYKSADSLHVCVDSILAQEFTDFELFLVDDGSPDNSGKICDEYAKNDNRIRVIHQENKGAAAARNAAIELAIGEYLTFCDSDDMVSPQWIKHMLHYSEKDTFVVGAFCTKREELGQEKRIGLDSGKTYGKKDYYLFNRAGIAGFLWNAMYRRDIIDNLNLKLREKHDLGDYNEDLIFATTYVQLINKIIYTGFADYYYDTHEDSLSRSNKQYYFVKYAEKYRIWDDFLHKYNAEREDYRRELSTSMLYHFLGALRETSSLGELKNIIPSFEIQKCLELADTSHENQFEIDLLRKKQVALLFGFYKALKIKEKILS